MTGDSTLELWTTTIDGAVLPGSICIYLRERPINVLFLELSPVPIPLVSITSPTSGFSCSVNSGVNGIGSCSGVTWPSGSWQKLRIKMVSSPNLALGSNSRIEIGLSVNSAGTSADSLEFFYDHPTFDSRFEVITTTPL